MPSTDHDSSPCSQNTNCPPKRFLRKGEGLKRFAEYKPPLPTTVKKAERRRTFVKFNMDGLNKKSVNKDPPLHFLPPEILNDDSINLSTEIPKIAPPKIIHTPIRPSRQALGAITNRSSDESPDSPAFLTDSKINGNIDNLLKKVEEKKSMLNDEYRDYNDSFVPSQRGDKTHDKTQKKLLERNFRSKQQSGLTDSDETDDASGSNSPSIARPLARTLKVGSGFDLSAPSHGNCALELGMRIQQIESTLTELREKINKCECGVAKPEDPPTQTANRRRPVTRAAAKAAITQTNHSQRVSRRSTRAVSNCIDSGPSANADNCNTTKQVLNNLVNEVAELKARMSNLHLIEH